jgi:hypothetical protein
VAVAFLVHKKKEVAKEKRKESIFSFDLFNDIQIIKISIKREGLICLRSNLTFNFNPTFSTSCLLTYNKVRSLNMN